MHRTGSAIGAKQVNHWLIAFRGITASAERGAERVGGTLDFHVRVGAMLKQELDDIDVAVDNRRMQSVAARRDMLFRQVWVGSRCEQQLYHFEVSGGCGVPQRRAGTGIVGGVLRRTVR